jgi:hypothetical protein
VENESDASKSVDRAATVATGLLIAVAAVIASVSCARTKHVATRVDGTELRAILVSSSTSSGDSIVMVRETSSDYVLELRLLSEVRVVQISKREVAIAPSRGTTLPVSIYIEDVTLLAKEGVRAAPERLSPMTR